MYEKGQKLVIRSEAQGDRVVLVEDLIADDEGQKLKVRDLNTNVSRVVNPHTQTVVEHLED